MSGRPLGIGIVGCGMIAEAYATDLASYDDVRLVGVTDLDLARAEALAAKRGWHPYPSLQELLEEEDVDAVVNLTFPSAHRDVTEACLEAGKHVYSEKPLALTSEDAKRLVELAAERNLRLGCSPCTLMGEAQQTAWKVIREGRLGQVRVVYAEANGGRLETWHPAPAQFYAVGALSDIGVYPLTLIAAMLGPARRVSAAGRVIHPERVTAAGVRFEVATPDFAVLVLELAGGTIVRLTANFYVPRRSTKQVGVEFHGDDGSLYLSDWQRFDATVEYASFGKECKYTSVPLVAPAHPGTEWGRGVREMAQAIAEGRPHRATGELAAHVVEIVCATACSIELGEPVEIRSSFTPPEPMGWAA